ncbi:MAG: glycosyltransferase, partial [Anaerolineaceae bacterium]|nr:glycosyltransferase [Anaerolineaceae bacterium]
MRILYFTRDHTPHDHRFLAALAESEHEVFSLRLEQRGSQTERRPLPSGARQISWRGGSKAAQLRDYPGLLTDLKRVLKEIKPDVVHAGSIQTAAFLTALSGYRPLVSMSWGSDLLMDADRSPWSRWVTVYTLRRSAVMIADCQTVQRKAEAFGFPAERVVLFPWGVDLKHFAPGSDSGFRQRLGWQEVFVLLSLRAWEPLYGVDNLVRAFARAAVREPCLRLLLLGGGSQAENIRQIISQHKLENRVYCGGQITYQDLPSYYRAADVYISASHSDGSSVSLLEALACGLPVIVSDIPSNLEWIKDGVQGWCFNDGD